ncbi:MAG: dihydroneopterin aldolase [Bacteroidetes bacterium]|nr:dihydroneopterin aldolase [Bacteroidota bacterium]
MHTVKLVNCEFYAHHGVMKEEHQVGGRYSVDAEMKLDFEKAALTDDLNETVDYEVVYKLMKEVIVAQKVYLIEALSLQLAQAILNRFPSVQMVTTRVRKINPPVGGVCDYAEVEYSRSR